MTRMRTFDIDLKEACMQQPNDSATEVNYPQNVLSGFRKTFGFKCDTGLAEAFKPVAKRYFGSICRPLECFMLAVLALQKEKVNFGETVRIENLNIQRNLRSRRKLVVEDEVVETVKEPCCGFCGRKPVVTGFRHVKSGICKYACSYHTNVLQNRTDWTEEGSNG